MNFYNFIVVMNKIIMNLPSRCYSCNKVIGDLWDEYNEKIKTEDFIKVCKELNIERICCKRMFMTCSDFYKKFSQYDKAIINFVIIKNYSDNFNLLSTT